MAHRLARDAGPDRVRAGPESGTERESITDEQPERAALRGAPINRRTWLTTVGAFVVAPAVATRGVRADDHGYGLGEYGSGPYGEPTSDDDGTDQEYTLAVSTGDATDVETGSATLHGELTDLVGYDAATVYFEWGSGDGLANQTDAQSVTEPEAISADLSGLESDTTYEFRIVAEAGDESDAGDVASFTTPADEEPSEEEPGTDDPESDPVIVDLSGRDTSNPRNPHADIQVEWEAAIDDGELSAATVEISNWQGTLHTCEYTLSGQTAERSHTERIKFGGGDIYTIELTVESEHDTDTAAMIEVIAP